MTAHTQPGEPGVGPLRIWPGGLALSRSFGDLEVDACVLSAGYVMQVGRCTTNSVLALLDTPAQSSSSVSHLLLLL